MKYGSLLLLIGLILGFLASYLAINAVHTVERYEAGVNFVNGIGVGFGASVGLVLMIWVLKTCDRLLAANTPGK